jgi:hypothetical protein
LKITLIHHRPIGIGVGFRKGAGHYWSAGSVPFKLKRREFSAGIFDVINSLSVVCAPEKGCVKVRGIQIAFFTLTYSCLPNYCRQAQRENLTTFQKLSNLALSHGKFFNAQN